VDHGRIVVVSASVGAGHDGPAAELTRRLREGGWRVDRVDCLDVLPIGLGDGCAIVTSRRCGWHPARGVGCWARSEVLVWPPGWCIA